MAPTRAVLLMLLLETPYYKFNKRVGIHPINKERHVFAEFHYLYHKLRKFPYRFFNYMRMSVGTFDYLLNRVSHRLEKTVTNFVKNRYISPAERLVITIRFLTTGTTYKHVAHEFRIGYSTASAIVRETCPVIWEELVEDHMPVCTQQQLEQIIQEYNTRWNFPNCFGSIDGKHCQIRCPPNTGTTYFNYLKYYSLGLQGVADAKKKFITIEVGSRGSESDGGVFQSSTLYNLLESNQFNVPPEQALPNSNIILPNVMIEDEAYPLKKYLMRPYPRPRTGILNNEKQLFNDRLSRARKCIEDAFGILYQKFRIFDTSILLKEETAINVIKCACILHNLIRDFDGNDDLDYIHVVDQAARQNNVNLNVRNNRASNLATQIRDSFKDYFCNNIPN